MRGAILLFGVSKVGESFWKVLALTYQRDKFSDFEERL